MGQYFSASGLAQHQSTLLPHLKPQLPGTSFGSILRQVSEAPSSPRKTLSREDSNLFHLINRFRTTLHHLAYRLRIPVKMSWFGVTPLKKFPAPVLRPMAPFFIAGLVIYTGVAAAQDSMMGSDEWKNDPRNKKAGAKH